MSNAMNPTAPHHLPVFFSAPDGTDFLFNVMLIVIIVMVLLVAVLYFKLHSLPERIAHKGQKIQFELVAVLALISLFTHNHFFWIAGLLLAFIPIPDFATPLTGMAESLAKMAGGRRRTEEAATSATLTSGPSNESMSGAIGSGRPGASGATAAGVAELDRSLRTASVDGDPATPDVRASVFPSADLGRRQPADSTER